MFQAAVRSSMHAGVVSKADIDIVQDIWCERAGSLSMYRHPRTGYMSQRQLKYKYVYYLE